MQLKGQNCRSASPTCRSPGVQAPAARPPSAVFSVIKAAAAAMPMPQSVPTRGPNSCYFRRVKPALISQNRKIVAVSTVFNGFCFVNCIWFH